MLYTDLSYYKLSVHLHIPVIWSERFHAQNRVLEPFVHCHKDFQSFRRAVLVL